MSDFRHHMTLRLQQLLAEEKEAKIKKDQLQQAIESDEEYRLLKERADEAVKRARLHKEALLNEPEVRKIKEELKDTQQEIKDIKYILSQELLNIYTVEKTLEFEDANGEMHRINIKAWLKKTNQPSMF